MKIKNEKLFLKFSQVNAEVSEKGRKQFFEHQSYGEKPKDPDPYYLRLSNGKKWFDFQIQEYLTLYDTQEWWGWYSIVNDYLQNKDETWILPYLFPWRKDIQSVIKDCRGKIWMGMKK